MKEEIIEARVLEYGKLKSIYNDIVFFKKYSEILGRSGESVGSPPPSLRGLQFVQNRIGPLKVVVQGRSARLPEVNAVVLLPRDGVPKFALADFSNGIKVYLSYEKESPIVGIDIGLRHLFTVVAITRDKLYKTRFFGDREVMETFTKYLGEEQGVTHLEEIKVKVRRIVKEATSFVKELEPKVVAIEDLREYEGKVGKGLRVLQDMLEKEFYSNGVRFRRMDPYNTSKLCSHCGYKKGEVMGSIFVCPSCGYKADRDFNAAYNLALMCYYAC
ncbi:MAG: transposase [Candidatus Aramenus sp.]|jgi:hypothetical protein|nr:transposase [Candidatus Aramenus sp.]